MENKSDKGGFWKRQSFLLPPLTAAVVLLCQQMASSNPSGVVTVNILLLVLNFFSYVGLLRGEKSTEKSVAIAAAGFITLMAFVFNTCVAGIPTPLSDTGIFMNSLCGMWVLVAVVIASEDNIEDEENYKTFKEKVVERTVKLDMEYRRIQQEMIEDYKTETSEYKEFLKKESPKLFQVFEESGSRNLRTFKSCLIDFERVYGLWHSLKLPTDGMGEAL